MSYEEKYDDGYGENKSINIKKAELDDLRQYFEMPSNEIMLKSLQLMYDILQANKIGWKFGFMKIRKEDGDSGDQVFDTEYFPNVIPIGIENIAPPNMRVNHEEFENLKIDY